MNKQYLILATACLLISNALALVTPSRFPTLTFLRVSQLSAASNTVDAPTIDTQPKSVNCQQQQNVFSDKTDDLWEVRVYNDNINTHEWVARCLVVIADATEWQAYQTTKAAHQEGDAFLGLYEKEIAEIYTEGLRQQGIIVRMFPVGDFQ